MNLISILKSIWNDILALFFPNLCAVCDTPLVEHEQGICLGCISRIPRTGNMVKPDNETVKRFWGKFPIEHGASFFHFHKGENSQKIIHAIKYKNDKDLAIQMGALFADELNTTDWIRKIDILIPVPLHRNRLQTRGYNQSELIAQGIASVLKLPIDTSSVIKAKPTSSQTKKGIYERWLNVNETFSVTSAAHLQDKHILIIDDVITTGATIDSLAHAILPCQNVKISVISLAIAT